MKNLNSMSSEKDIFEGDIDSFLQGMTKDSKESTIKGVHEKCKELMEESDLDGFHIYIPIDSMIEAHALASFASLHSSRAKPLIEAFIYQYAVDFVNKATDSNIDYFSDTHEISSSKVQFITEKEFKTYKNSNTVASKIYVVSSALRELYKFYKDNIKDKRKPTYQQFLKTLITEGIRSDYEKIQHKIRYEI